MKEVKITEVVKAETKYRATKIIDAINVIGGINTNITRCKKALNSAKDAVNNKKEQRKQLKQFNEELIELAKKFRAAKLSEELLVSDYKAIEDKWRVQYGFKPRKIEIKSAYDLPGLLGADIVSSYIPGSASLIDATIKTWEETLGNIETSIKYIPTVEAEVVNGEGE